ncbi:hypothetical protein IQ238_03095 [Pleurocapsales cyanobacterium LEGE 06147]|nr:hypothetical protein [Pleurocapsales cyanobacterium LEGE 06147]
MLNAVEFQARIQNGFIYDPLIYESRSYAAIGLSRVCTPPLERSPLLFLCN